MEYTRNQFDLCPVNLLTSESVPDTVISQTQAMQSASLGMSTGQLVDADIVNFEMSMQESFQEL